MLLAISLWRIVKEIKLMKNLKQKMLKKNKNKKRKKMKKQNKPKKKSYMLLEVVRGFLLTKKVTL